MENRCARVLVGSWWDGASELFHLGATLILLGAIVDMFIWKSQSCWCVEFVSWAQHATVWSMCPVRHTLPIPVSQPQVGALRPSHHVPCLSFRKTFCRMWELGQQSWCGEQGEVLKMQVQCAMMERPDLSLSLPSMVTSPLQSECVGWTGNIPGKT
jgi:hypothetical protein